MKKIFPIILFLITGTMLQAQSIYPGGQSETGTGGRAFALANNHTALSTGIADLYWNPAALAFSVSREFQLSLYGMKLKNESTYLKKTTGDDLQRFRVGSAGFSIALPTSRGGITLAGSYSNPIILDDIFRFSGTSTDDGIITDLTRSYRVSGNLNYWSVGIGLQVAPNFSVGIATSLISGKGSGESFLDKESITASDDTLVDYDDYSIEGRYIGYDLRAGVFYTTKIVSAGARLILPQIIRYSDYANGVYWNDYIDGTDLYNMYAPYKGAIGVGLTLPFFTVSSELRLTLPFDFLFPVEKIPDNSQAGEFKTGAGIGIEVPLVIVPIIFRTGYSYDDLDLHPYAYDFISRPENTKDFDWSDAGQTVKQNLHRISAGVGYTTESMSFDLSYGVSTWGITTYAISTNTNLEQNYLQHYVLASVSVRF